MNARATALRTGLLLALLYPAAALASAGGLAIATPDTASTGTGQPVSIDVLANDHEVGGTRRLLSALPPANGRTAVVDGQVRYTPDAGFVGSDQFQYLVQAPKSPPRIGTVTVEVGGGGVLLTVNGQVVDDPIAGATVTVSVGGIDFTAVADANGFYAVDIAALDGDDLVTITAVGISATGAPVEFVSLVGAIARLSGEAGADGVLTMDENGQVDVTHLSTAQYVLLADANGGTPPQDDAGLLQLTQNIDLDAMIELAAIIKLVVDGGEPLPDGVDSVLDLISDDAATATFVAALDPGQLDAAIAEVGDDGADLAAFTPTRMPNGYAAIFPGATGTIRVGVGGQFLLAFDGVGSASSGTGTIIDFRFRDDPGISWQIVGDVLQVRYDQPLLFEIDKGDASCSWHEASTLLGMDITRLQDGAAVDYLHVVEHAIYDYTDHDPGNPCAPADGPVAFAPYTALGFADGAGERPYEATESLGTMMLPLYRPELYPHSPNGIPWGAALFDFATSQVQLEGVDPAFAWSIAGGRLQVAVTDPVNGTRAHEFRRYQSDGRKGEGVMAVVTDALGRRAALYDMSVRVDGSLPAFTAAMLPGRWRSGFDISRFPGEFEVYPGFFMRLHDDLAHTGIFETVTDNGDGTSTTALFSPLTWSVADSVDAGLGAMEARTFRWNGPQVAWCEVGVDAGCTLWRRRTWTPLAIDGNRVYVLERLNYTVLGAVELVSARANFYEVGPIP